MVMSQFPLAHEEYTQRGLVNQRSSHLHEGEEERRRLQGGKQGTSMESLHPDNALLHPSSLIYTCVMPAHIRLYPSMLCRTVTVFSTMTAHWNNLETPGLCRAIIGNRVSLWRHLEGWQILSSKVDIQLQFGLISLEPQSMWG